MPSNPGERTNPRTTPPKPAEAPRRRRSRHEIDGLILRSAREVFALKGYAGATMREVAERAGVYEPMLYRRFETKAALFEGAVLAPFGEVISGYLSTWEAQAATPTSLEELVRAFVEPLYDLFSEHRELALALVASRDFRRSDATGDGEAEQPLLLRLVDRMELQQEIEAARRPLRVNFPSTILVTIGMALGLALLDEAVLTSRYRGLTRDQLVDEMVAYCLHGVMDPDYGSPPSNVGDEAAPLTGDMAVALLDRVAEAERRAIRAELRLEQLTGRRLVHD
jgi:AcrR family transcriptional regulator